MCFTEKRILKPGLELITRRCKQEQACIQQQNQVTLMYNLKKYKLLYYIKLSGKYKLM